MRAIIFDADGTLTDPSHRLHFLDREPKDWVSFHDGMVDDPPHSAVVWLAKTLLLNSTRYDGVDCDGKKFVIIVVSARHEDYREKTLAWLERHGIFPDRLYMRQNDDYRPDYIIKSEILEQMVADGYEPMLVVDDRTEVVEMWRDWGLTALQCDPGVELTKYQGKHMLTLLVGPAGCGKSTYVEKNYTADQIVSTDAIRREMFGDHGEDVQFMEANARVFGFARDLVKARVRAGLFTVVDATNLRREHRLNFVRAVPRSVMVEYVLLDRRYDDKVATRGWRSTELIDSHHQQFKNALPDLMVCDERPNVYVSDKRQHRV